MQQHGSKLNARSPPYNHWVKRSKFNPLRTWGQNSTFSEHGRVAYQIIGNHKCCNFVENILPADLHPSHPDPGGWGQKIKIQLFQNMVMLNIE